MPDEPSNEEVRQAALAKLAPACEHFWNHLAGMKICPICFDKWKAENALKRRHYRLTRGFYRALHPNITRAELKRLDAERNKIVIVFKLLGKRGKTYCLQLEPNHEDIGGVLVELFQGVHPAAANTKPLARAIIPTGEFAAVGALITNPEIIPHD